MRIRPVPALILSLALAGPGHTQTTGETQQASTPSSLPGNPLATQPVKLTNPKPVNDKPMAPVTLKEPAQPTVIQTRKLGSVAPERYDPRDATYPSPVGAALLRRLDEPAPDDAAP